MLSVAISCLQLLLSLQAAQQPAYILHPPYFHSVPDLINATSAAIAPALFCSHQALLSNINYCQWTSQSSLTKLTECSVNICILVFKCVI